MLLGTDNTAPYSFTWANVTAGMYNITAKATDNQGASTTSAVVKIVVNNQVIPNQFPTCMITQPLANQIFTAPANVVINANANDLDGTITKVDFYNGSTLLGADNIAPFSITWSNVAAGTYDVSVKATDNLGAVTTSSVVSILVNPPVTSNTCSQYAQYIEASPYTNGSIVTNNGGVFSCLVAGWCSGAAFAYSPGLGTAWQSAWSQTGTCTQAAPNCNTTPNYVALTTYQTGSIVKNINNLYQCVIPSWCSGVAIAYAPGVGSAWSSAWNLMGACPGISPKIVSSNPKQIVAELFPNPTTDELNVVIENAPLDNLEMSLFDNNGKQIFVKNIENKQSIFTEKVDMSNVPQGIYYLKLTNPNWTNTWRVIKL
jgi:hypothetical protein